MLVVIYEVYDDFIVWVGFEYGIFVFEIFFESDVVVNFIVNGEDKVFVFVGKGLSIGVCEIILLVFIWWYFLCNFKSFLIFFNIIKRILLCVC